MTGVDEVRDREGAADLARLVMDPARTRTVVAVSVAEDREKALLDVPSLRKRTASWAEVRVLRTGPATWELKSRLPGGLDVYGDAVRIWRPGIRDRNSGSEEHPLLLLREGPDPEVLAAQVAELVLGLPGAIAKELPVPPPGATGWGGDPRSTAGPAEEGVAHETRQLAEVVDRALAALEESRRVFAGSQDLVAILRGAAEEIRQELETDLVLLRERVLRSVEEERDKFEGAAAAALAQARAEADRLRQALDGMTQEQHRLESQVAQLSRVEVQARERVRSARAAARRQRERADALQRELDSFVPAEKRFVVAVRRAWLRTTTKEDRLRFPWREPVIGPDFLESLDRVEGVSRDRVVEVCAEVVSGRAAVRSGLQVHALRAHAGGGSAQRVREDGARAFRASLQVRSAAARRLHFWELDDGRIELAKIAYHDDFAIT